MGNQLRTPQLEDTEATIKTTMGDIKVLLFPEAAPKAVENFVSLANSGYYNGIIFHRVIPDFMIQGGDPTGTGMGGKSVWGKPFKDEFHPYYHNLCGALSMANSGPGTNGSQFFIVQLHEFNEDFAQQMEQMPESFPPEVVENYKKLGGTPWLDYRHTVFGQVFEGMDVVDAIANVERNAKDKPVEDIKIIEVTIE